MTLNGNVILENDTGHFDLDKNSMDWIKKKNVFDLFNVINIH